MDLNELRNMTVPKLRERAKEFTDLQGVSGMKKEELIGAIAKAEGISHEAEAPQKVVTTISSIKQEIRGLRKQKEEILASSRARHQLERIRKRIKRLKRLTRKMAREKAPQEASPPPAETSSSTPEAEPTPAPST